MTSKYDSSHPYATLAAAMCCGAPIFLILLFLGQKRQEKVSPLPPGPRRLPVIGNLFQIATSGSRLWETASKWGKTYGDMVYLEVTGIPALVINSHEVAIDLLSRRSSNYSSRPQLVMSSLAGWEWATPILVYGERLRKQRALMHKNFLTPDVLNYLEIQQQKCHKFLGDLLETPEKYHKHARWLPAAVTMMNTYGHEVENEDDHYVRLGDESVKVLANSIGYISLDLFPWLQYLPGWCPGTGFRSTAKKWRQLSEAYRRELYDLTKKKVSEGTAKESMTTHFLSDASSDASVSVNETEFTNIAATVFLGGGDTTYTAIMNFVLAMLKYPEVQRRAQEELDRVVGTDRLPMFQDKERLPYVNALCDEVLRWEIVAPFGVPHCTTKEDEYRGYRIPAGTIILANAWAMSRDETIYPDPTEFKPERWLPGGDNFNSARPSEFAFGFGRRICPGRVWAEHLLFITASSLLATFNFERALDANRNPEPLNDVHESSFMRSLGPSTCTIEPRSEKAASLIRDAF